MEQFSLQTLQQALDNASDEDVTNLIPFINAINQFPNPDIDTAKTLLRSTFWTEKSNTFDFTNRFKLLSAQNLAIVIQKLGNENIKNFIFTNNAKIILSHYPIADLISLLNAFYSDRFANFVFNAFKAGFLKERVSVRVKYLKVISVKAIIQILKNGNVGKSLSNDELIVVCTKMKAHLQISNTATFELTDVDQTWQDCHTILPEIVQIIIGNSHNIKALTTDNLQSLLDNELISNMEQSRNVIQELLVRQRKSLCSSIGGTNVAINIGQKQSCDNLVGILSTDNFASFQQPLHNNSHTRQLLDGPMVIIPLDTEQSKHECISYSVLVQIQDLNPIFNQPTQVNRVNRQQTKGSLFIVLLRAIPRNYEIVLSVSTSYDSSAIKDLQIGMNNINPLCILPWPLPKVGRAVSFRLHCLLRPTQREVNAVQYGIGLLNPFGTEQKTQVSDGSSASNSLWDMSGNKMVMCVYSGQLQRNQTGFQQNNAGNDNRIPWVNVMAHKKMSFANMIDSATAQLGLAPPLKDSDDQKQQNNPNLNQNWGVFGQSRPCSYVVRNQLGHECGLDKNVVQYLDEMVMGLNVFPVFIFTTSDTQKRQRGGQSQPLTFNWN